MKAILFTWIFRSSKKFMSNIRRFIPVSQPLLDDSEKDHILLALEDGAISGLFGNELDKFEEEFSNYCGTKFGVSTSSGTTALHLALSVLDIKAGDEVLISTYTNMATFFAALYQGATPVPIDSEQGTWNMDPALLEDKITHNTKAIIVVHIFGHPVNMKPILEISRKYNLYVIEDCAQAHGAEFNGEKVGSLGDIGCFSFYANKIITTGEGGMLVTDDKLLAERARSVKSLAFGSDNKFMHKELGYNYRMSNIQAAIGCAQLLKIDYIIKRKREIAELYNFHLNDVQELLLPVEQQGCKNVYWMYHIVQKESCTLTAKQVMESLFKDGIETRPGFIPFNMQEIFIKAGLTKESDCPVANHLALNSYYLPSGPELTSEEVLFIADSLKKILIG
ncbi:MAG: perosamine synthetase [Gammaproteobacteria bacterium]|jgi:perosamine synthetase